MRKILFILTLLNLLIFPSIQAGEEETLTIITYFPIPYGVYNELTVHEGIVFRPQDDISSISPKKGKLVYGKKDASATEKKFYYWDGSEWREF